ncbi:uncharacterized protein LOC127247126 [Andrographis paniculata]|uniref:uncharacterized protein LOC127247126 n=1 Tax=Andrographis paniculata TaxID=175694 RepID=UPI0021E7995B|nr:uncharacterized protein LOC127247126 [Andrographis paniculata]XP_051124805.1 uncharacterized protein LOC127247126 [Andrographis paniculata]XP_051124807.1 uncharacterized protein LOC127247126 [Andrographis paniculata]XP_051124808.1 uncharacterized protein LOC127247126 [Andrographis paniculata]
MLSTENPPPDLPCPCGELISQSNNDEEGASDDCNRHNQLEVAADLFRSGPDDSNTLPKFSIRDYVFNTRGKNVENNWPFSLKNLQLCLKYGVKEVLPPFQSLDSVRNPSPEKPSGDNEFEVSDRSIGQEVAEDKNIDSGGFEEEDKALPSTTTSDRTCSDVNSTRQVRSPNLEPVAESFPSSKKLGFAAGASNKAKSSNQNPVKKCKLIVKLKSAAEAKGPEDLSANNFVVSDTMATKVCPVCKTFSSSSNTTLNAHIDQCLSQESSVKWTMNSKLNKHRIKPRKSRLMVDIYETAIPCTLEDLDKRNGTNWASNLGFSEDQDLETYADEKNINAEDDDQEGSVYIDSNGTKLRILSKLSDLPSNANSPAQNQGKISKKDKGIEHALSKKKLVSQKHKIIKSPPRVQRSSLRHHLEVECSQQKSLLHEGYKDDSMQPPESRDQMKSKGIGMIKQWVGSKRSGLKNKINLEPENQRPTKKSLKSVALGRESSSVSPILCDEDPILPTESNKRKAKLLCDSNDGFFKPPCQKKAPGISYEESGDRMNHGKRPRKDNQLVHASDADLRNGTVNDVLSQRNKKKALNISSSVNEESPLLSSRTAKPATGSGDKQFSPFKKKKLLSIRQASTSESKKLGIKHSEFKNPSRSEEEMINSKHETYRRESSKDNAAQSKRASAKTLDDGARVSKIHKKKGDMALNRSYASPESDSHDVDKNNNSAAGKDSAVGVSNVLENDKTHDEYAFDASHKVADEETFSAFSKSLETGFPALHYPAGGGYSCLAEPPLDGEQEGFCADKIENKAQGNYFVDVDPIPIPGPPGSFLPSPGRMSSEELQGNSSLTACMIQSSENDHEPVDNDSSDSPISATSAVSDSVAARSTSVSVNLRNEPVAIEQVATADRKSDPEAKSSSALHEMSINRFKSNSPCCCSRKDAAVPADSFVNQELRQQDKKLLDDRIEKSYLFNGRSETIPTKEPNPDSSIGYCPGLVSNHSEMKLSFHGDRESPSPSTPNPVLRLMGKNLMVANKGENLSLNAWPARSATVVNHPTPTFHVNDHLPSGKNLNELYSFCPNVSQVPSIFLSSGSPAPAQSFDFSSYDGFKIPATVRLPWLSAHQSPAMFRNENFGGNNFAPSSAASYDIEHAQSPIPGGLKHKEVIVIDEQPGNKAAANPAMKGMTSTQELNRNMRFGESSATMGLQCESRRVDPFYYHYQMARGGYALPVAQNGNNTRAPPASLYFSSGFS